MIIPDINLILYAHINSFEHHKEAKNWWVQSLNEEEPIGLVAPVVFGFLRISTNKKIFSDPLTPLQAVHFAEQWLERSHVHFLTPGSQHLALAFSLIRKLGVAGDLTTDVQIAAVALEHQATVLSNDADFKKFPGLRCQNPLKHRRKDRS